MFSVYLIFHDKHHRNHRLGDQGRRRAGLVLPGRGQDSLGLVVAGQPVDAGLDQNQTELAVRVLAVPLQVLADGDGLLDQVVQILGDVGLQANGLHDPQDLVAIDETHLRHTVGVTEDDSCNEGRTGKQSIGCCSSSFMTMANLVYADITSK